MRKLFHILLPFIIVSCHTNSSVNDSDKKLIGKYKQTTDISYEILKLENNYKLVSIYSSRAYKIKKIKENGFWQTKGDTLIIKRVRHDLLKEHGYPEIVNFLIRKNKLFVLDTTYSGEIFETHYFFSKY